jgi:hypothetical protein
VSSQRDSFRPTWTCGLFALCALAGCLLGACTVSVDSDRQPLIYEAEPNDGSCCAQFVGDVVPYTQIDIAGSVTALGPDLFDGFAIFAVDDCEVFFELESADDLVDLDLCVYDPLVGDFVACFQSPFGDESGSFPAFAGQDLQVVVSSSFGAASYRLALRTYPLSALPAAAPDRAGACSEKLELYRCPPAAPVEEAEPRAIARGVLVELDGDEVRVHPWIGTSDGVLRFR